MRLWISVVKPVFVLLYPSIPHPTTLLRILLHAWHLYA
jgi:hypothetical protein